MDYPGIKALAAVVAHQSFEKAARHLAVTQSAVSQRLSSLEAYYGKRLLVRELPYRPTALGERLLSHLRQVLLLEEEFETQLNESEALLPIRIAVNRDSLDMWFHELLVDEKLGAVANLEIISDDQKLTVDYLRRGQVDLAISSQAEALAKCESVSLGKMTYLLVCRPDFAAKHFPQGLRHGAIAQAPAVIFDEKDDIHTRYLAEKFGFDEPYPRNTVPSVKGYKSAIVAGFGYGLVPLMDIRAELEQGTLVRLGKRYQYDLPLFLHYWSIQSPRLKLVIEAVRKAAKTIS